MKMRQNDCMGTAAEQQKRYWEDFTPGWSIRSPAQTVTKEQILAFANEFDPQPFHLDEEAAKDTLLGGLAASGWHTCGLLMKMMCEIYLLNSASMGSPGIDETRWLKPVRPGDSLAMKCTCIESRISASRPEMGICKMHWEMLDCFGEPVMTMTGTQLFKTRQAASA